MEIADGCLGCHPNMQIRARMVHGMRNLEGLCLPPVPASPGIQLIWCFVREAQGRFNTVCTPRDTVSGVPIRFAHQLGPGAYAMRSPGNDCALLSNSQ